jgi:hypothetical protein
MRKRWAEEILQQIEMETVAQSRITGRGGGRRRRGDVKGTASHNVIRYGRGRSQVAFWWL